MKIYEKLAHPFNTVLNDNRVDNKDKLQELLTYKFKLGKETKKEEEIQGLLREAVYNDPITLLNTHIGIEIEIENLLYIPRNNTPLYEYWQVTNDGSLRNAGREFVSKLGMRLHNYKDTMDIFYKEIVPHNLGATFTERCSTHLHVDVRLFTEEKIKFLVALYLIVEKGFFSFTSPLRQKNIFCIALKDSSKILTNYKDMERIIHGWEKYTAFNLKPIYAQGTVEFRHLHGTYNYYELLAWILLCLRLVNYTYFTPEKEILHKLRNLKYESQYDAFLETIFSSLRHLVQWDYNEMDSAATSAKFILNQDFI